MVLVAVFGLSLSWLPQHVPTSCIAARPSLARAAVAVCVESQAYRPRGRGSAGAVRNQGARTIVTKLTSLRSRNGAVDMDGLGRLLRGYDIQGPMLLDVLQGLKHQDRWEMCQAVARYVEASYPAKRRGVPATREDLPRFQALSPTDDGEDLDMGQLLAMQGEEVNPLDSVLPVDTVHYNVMISACARPRRWKEALELFDRMRKRNVERSTVTYNSLLHVMHRAGRWRLALKLLKQMRREKVAPDTVTFSSAIAACGSAGEWQRALLLLPLMASAGVSPNTITFSSCITACEKKGEWRPALQVLETMATLDLAPDLICCNAAIGACARAGEPAQAQTVLREVLAANGIAPDTKSYNGLLTAYANAQPAQWQGALETLEAFAADGGTPDLYTCNAALSALGKAGEWERAIAFLEAMPATYGVAADAVSYTSAISGCERAGEWMAAMQLLRQMRDAGVRPTMLSYSKLLFVHAAAGQWEAAVEFIEAGTADGLLHNPLTLNRMLEACVAAGSAAAAEAGLAAVLPVLSSATAAVPGPMVFDRESLRMIEALTAKQATGLAPTEVGEEVAAGEWEAAAEAELSSSDLAGEIKRSTAKLLPLLMQREEMDSRRAQSSDQVKIDWEKTFPEGFNSKVLAALWMPETA